MEPTLSLFIDCTKSNLLNGARSFAGKSLHDVSTPALNPYEQALSALLPALSFCQIRLYGFGCATSGSTSTFPFSRDGSPLADAAATLALYRKSIPTVALAGPTCFAPSIKRALQVYEKCTRKRGLHFSLILCDSPANSFKDTYAALVEASKVPLSVLLLGVGDGPWADMHAFQTAVHAPPTPGTGSRKYNNCNFVEMEAVRAAVGEGGSLTSALAAALLADLPRQLQDLTRKGMLKK